MATREIKESILRELERVTAFNAVGMDAINHIMNIEELVKSIEDT